MPRLARVIVPGLPHHVTQRGNNRQDVFFVDDDRRAYLDILSQQAALHGVRLLAYCLMTNHVHLIAVPRREGDLARAIGRTHWRYTQYLNRLHKRSGHLWQSRFFSCPLDPPHCLTALRYVETNPVRARLVRVAGRYAWSSAAAHTGGGGKDASGFLDLPGFAERTGAVTGPAWAKVLADPLPAAALGALRGATHTGRPLATDAWLSKLEAKLGRRLRPLPVGRPRKAPRKSGKPGTVPGGRKRKLRGDK